MFFLYKETDVAFVENDKPKLVKINYTLAKRFRDMERYPRDRDLQIARLGFIRKAIEQKEFRGSELVSAYCKETEKTYRLNGKHTSNVLCEFFESGQDPECYMLVREYSCDNMEDMARLFATFDARQSARTKSDVIRGFAAASPLVADIPGKVLSLATAALAMNLWEDSVGQRTSAEQAMLMIQHADFVVWAVEMIGGEKKCFHMHRVPVVAAMARTWFKAKGPATEFWTKIRDDSDDILGSPTRKLHRWLLTHTLSSNSDKSTKEKATQREMMVRCLHYWNGWRKNTPTDGRYFPNAKIPSAA